MKALALVLAMLAGCSFFRAGPANSTPAHGCTRGSAYGDFALAAVGIAAIATSKIVINCIPDSHCADRVLYEVGITSGVTLAFIELLQGVYGLSTAHACEVERAKLRPVLQ